MIDKRAPSAFDGTAPGGASWTDRGVEAVVVAGFTSADRLHRHGPGGPRAALPHPRGRRRHRRRGRTAAMGPPSAHDRALTAQRRLGAEVLSTETIESLLGAAERIGTRQWSIPAGAGGPASPRGGRPVPRVASGSRVAGGRAWSPAALPRPGLLDVLVGPLAVAAEGLDTRARDERDVRWPGARAHG